MPHLLRLVVGAVDLRRVALVLANGQRYAVASITGSLIIDRWVLRAPIVTVKDPAGEARGRGATPRGAADGRERHAFRALAAAGRSRLPVLERGGRQSRPAGHRPAPGATRAPELHGQRARPDGYAAGARHASCHRLRRLAVGPCRAFPARSAARSRSMRGGTRSVSTARLLPRTSSMSRCVCRAVEHGRVASSRSQLFVRGCRAAPRRSRRPGRSISHPNRRCSRCAASGPTLRWPLTGEPMVASALGAYRIGGSLPYAYEVKAETAGAADTSGRMAGDGAGRPRCPHDRCRRRIHAARAHSRRGPPGVDRRPALAIYRAGPLARPARAARGSQWPYRPRRLDRGSRLRRQRSIRRACRIAQRRAVGPRAQRQGRDRAS